MLFRSVAIAFNLGHVVVTIDRCGGKNGFSLSLSLSLCVCVYLCFCAWFGLILDGFWFCGCGGGHEWISHFSGFLSVCVFLFLCLVWFDFGWVLVW